MTDLDTRAGERRNASPQRTRRPSSPRPVQDNSPDLAVNGLLDIVDDRAWLRADGYLPSPDDIAVPTALLRSHGLRRGGF